MVMILAIKLKIMYKKSNMDSPSPYKTSGE